MHCQLCTVNSFVRTEKLPSAEGAQSMDGSHVGPIVKIRRF